MTTSPQQPIRRRADGSIDIAFYAKRASAMRQADMQDFAHRCLANLRSAAGALRRIAVKVLGAVWPRTTSDGPRSHAPRAAGRGPAGS